MSNKAIMLCVPVADVQRMLRKLDIGDSDYIFDRKNYPNVEFGTKIYLYCVKDGLVTTTDEQGKELWVRGNAVGKNGKFYNGKVYAKCEYNILFSNLEYESFSWGVRNIHLYNEPKSTWNFKQYGKDKPMYRAISDWCYVEELGDDKIED